MSPRRALMVVTALAVTTFFLLLLWPSAPVPPDTVTGQAHHTTATTSRTAGPHTASPDEHAMSQHERRQARLIAMREALDQARQRPGNLQRDLAALQRLCDPDEDCQAMLAEALAGYPDRDFANLVSNAIARLPLYEDAMARTVMSTALPPRDRYQAIHALRLETLGAEETEALFGQERAWAEYQFAFGDLVTDPALAQRPAADRLAALESLRQQALGDYAADLAELEGPWDRYERELALLSVGIEDAGEQQAIARQLQQRHFDADTAAALAARQAQVSAQQQAVQNYQAAVTALREELAPLAAQMDQASWQTLYEQRLTALRLQHFPSP